MKQIKIYIFKLFESGDILEFFFCSMLAVLLYYSTTSMQIQYKPNMMII